MDSSSSRRRIVLLSSGYALFFLVTLHAAYTNRLPLDWLAQLPYYDKLGHFVLYFIPTYLGHRLFKQKHIRLLSFSLPLFPILFTLFTLTEELIQGFSPYRTLDPIDLICSLIGITCGYLLAQKQSAAVETKK